MNRSSIKFDMSDGVSDASLEGILTGVVRTTSPSGQASGFVVETTHGPFLVTAARVAAIRTKRLLVTFEGANRMLQIAYSGKAGGSRVAMCRIVSANFIPPLPLQTTSLPRVSQRIFTIGFLSGIRGLGVAAEMPFVLGATVAAVATGSEGGGVLYLDGSFNPGMIGGPVVRPATNDRPPEVVGVTLGSQPIETRGAAGLPPPIGGHGDAEVDSRVIAVLSIGCILDLIEGDRLAGP